MNIRDVTIEETKEAISSVEKIRSSIDKADMLNGDEASVISNALEMYVNKFKLTIPTVAVESIVGNTHTTQQYCNRIITALESRLSALEMI